MSEQKTHAEIIEEMNCGPIPEHQHDREILRDYADRLEAAHKREVDALMDEMNEQIADLRKQRDLWSQRAAELVEKCNEQYAKMKREMATTENSSAVGNAAKLRETLKATLDLFWDIHNANRSPQSNQAYAVIRQIKAALAAPARNCDVGTAKEQGKRFTAFCYKNRNAERCCGDCPAFNKGGFAECELTWAQIPYEEGGAK